YVETTGDALFERDIGLELLAETARLWCSLGHHDAQGQFRIDGVTGPDEYSAVADNNVYTNLMAQQNLLAAADTASRHPDQARDLGIEEEETARWRDAAEAMFIPYDDALGVHPQAEGFTDHRVWDFAATRPEQYPLLLHFPYFDLYRKQVVKQADLVLAMQRRGDAFTPDEMDRNFTYYERLTVRDSSLSTCTQAVVAAEVGHLGLAYDYLAEAALMDLDNLEHNTRDGLHMAALAGGWIALAAGLAGTRYRDGTLHFAARLPGGIDRLAFGLRFRGRSLHIEAAAGDTTYRLATGDPLEICHFGEATTVAVDEPVSRPTPRPTGAHRSPTPTQPAGREPPRRHAGTDPDARGAIP